LVAFVLLTILFLSYSCSYSLTAKSELLQSSSGTEAAGVHGISHFLAGEKCAVPDILEEERESFLTG
jgi:hypothetical protein